MACCHRCYQDGQFEQAVGLAMDVRRLDKLEQSITRSSNQAATLSYALQACQQTVVNRAFRQEVGQTRGGVHSPELVSCQ